MYYIYILIENDIPFYVGKTNDLQQRLKNHKQKFKKNITIEEIDKVDDWKFWEIFYIDLFKSWGFNLLNKNKGGGGVTYHSLYTKQLISQTSKNNKEKKVSHYWKGKSRFRDPKTNIKIGKTHTGMIKKPCSIERKEKISKSNKGKKFNLGKKYNTITFKKVNQYDLEGNFIKEWNSVWEILDFYNKKRTNTSIFNCCQGKTLTAYGYKWKYKN